MDEPGVGGANHEYCVYLPNDDFNEELNASSVTNIYFQNGPIKESGVNGLTQEVLLAIVEHRLKGFQMGKYACAENAAALDHVRNAMEALKSRTEKRIQRGVEGTHNV